MFAMKLSEYIDEFVKVDGRPITLLVHPKHFHSNCFEKTELKFTPRDWELADRVVINHGSDDYQILKDRDCSFHDFRLIIRPANLLI